MRPAGSEGWIGLPSMNAPMQAMAAPFAVRCSTTVRSLSFTDGAWTIAFAEAGAETPSVAAERFDHLILAVPAPQAAALLATAGISLPEIDATEYAPCWTLMLACEDLHQDYETFASIAGGPIATIIDNDRRLAGNVGKSTFVMHASAAWSRAHSEAAAADVAPVLLRAFEARSVRPVQPHFVRAHRWRFANVERALGEPFIERPDLNLGLCGDWCLGGGIEGAFESGRALARAVLRSVFSDVE
jgi:predicted NAD/FAD-dependent oxidoreductase